ncbi:MAG: efflux RND transporter permease subunit [Gammaproteobacteria bacterium]|nr:efflux RND transporter permease subunit [Gammaproteobacteria bacterium]
MTGAIRYLVGRGLVVNLVSLFLVGLGVFAALTINREAFPNVNLDQIQINVVYPGAAPDEVEQLVITPLEQELRTLDGIDNMISMSFPGSGRINLELDPRAPNRERMVSDVSVALDRADLPADLPNDPSIREIDGSVFPVVRIAISAPRTEVELRRLGDSLQDDLLAINGVARVVISGERKSEYRVTVDPQAMQRYRLSVDEISQAIRGWNINAPGGDLDTPDGQRAVRVRGQFRNATDARDVVIRANDEGDTLTVGDVARVEERLERPRTLQAVSGVPGLNILVLKKTDGDIIDIVDSVKAYLDKVPERYGKDLRITTFQDFSRNTRIRLNVLTNNAGIGLILVLLSLVLFLRPSVAITTTWGLPIVFLAGLYILFVAGVTLNLISMMGFIIVLGMLVDDAIIVGENITYHMEHGMSPKHAATTGAVELIGPVSATILTTVAAFMPMMFMPGLIGKFVIGIPIVVMTLLVLSWMESFFILPSHVAHVTRPASEPSQRFWLVWMERIYVATLRAALWGRWITVLISVLVLAGALWLARTSMHFELFPAVGLDQYLVRVTAPPGTNLERMHQELLAIDQDLRSRINPDYLEATVLLAGQTSIDEGDPLLQRGSRFGQLHVIYTEPVSRPQHDAGEDMRRLEKVLPPRYPHLKIAFTQLRPGPPTGRALQVEFSGHRDEDSEQAARELIRYLETVPGVTGIDSGLDPGDTQVNVNLDRGAATYAGVDLATAARQIRAAVDGLVISTTRRGSEEVDVTIRFPETGDQLDNLRKLLIPNGRGGLVPLERLAQFEEVPGFTTIRHRDTRRVVSVVADVDTSIITSLEINRRVEANASQWLGELASRVDVRYGGEQEKNQESVASLIWSMAFALVAIFFILAIQFNNLAYPLTVMLSIPFGIIGIILSFYLHDLYWKPMPLSFFALMGMVALTGVVVNSALVLLVFVQRAIREGVGYKEALIQAGRRRIRAVFLTATTTVLGLLPTAYGWGGLDPFVAPMALALSSGLIFATFVTLLTIPAAFLCGVDVWQGLCFLFRGRGKADPAA